MGEKSVEKALEADFPHIEERPLIRRAALWYAVSAGIIFWAIHINAMPAFQPYICHSGQHFWYHVVSIVTAVPIVVAFWPSYRYWLHGETEGVRFLGALALLLNATFLLATLAEWATVFVIDSCAS